MSKKSAEIVSVRIVPNATGSPVGKLADAELVFEADAGPFSGMKLIGFAVWERRTGNGRNVTFPARQYSVNGERRSFGLLRPAGQSREVAGYNHSGRVSSPTRIVPGGTTCARTSCFFIFHRRAQAFPNLVHFFTRSPDFIEKQNGTAHRDRPPGQ